LLFSYFILSVHAILERGYLQAIELLRQVALVIIEGIQALPAPCLHLEEKSAFEPVRLTSPDTATLVSLPSVAFGVMVSLESCIVPAFLLTWLAFIDSVLTGLLLPCLVTNRLLGVIDPLTFFVCFSGVRSKIPSHSCNALCQMVGSEYLQVVE
jgi:hypothetical protein